MEFNFYEIKNIINCINELKDQDFPIKISHKLFKFCQKADDELKFVNKEFERLRNKYSITEGEISEEINKNIQEDAHIVMSMFIDIDFEPISISDIPNAIVISMQIYAMMNKLFKD